MKENWQSYIVFILKKKNEALTWKINIKMNNNKANILWQYARLFKFLFFFQIGLAILPVE